MKLVDEYGDMDITKDVFVKMLQETSAMMVAYTVEYYGLSQSDNKTLRLTNRVLQRTWNNSEWLEKYIAYLFKRAREINHE